MGYWFSDGASGWQSPAGAGFGFELTEGMLEVAMSPAIASLPAVATNDVERCVNRALEWFERAQLSADALMQLLFLFFALEAILGTERGPKARPLAVRRAILGLRTAGHFSHPYRMYGLYSQVRNAAVHGGEPPSVAEKDLAAFMWDTRVALNEYLEFASTRHMTERDAVRSELDGDPDAASIEEDFLP